MPRIARLTPRALAFFAFLPLVATIATWLVRAVQSPHPRVRLTPSSGNVIAWDSGHLAFEHRAPAVDADPRVAAFTPAASFPGDIAAIPPVSSTEFLGFTYAAGDTSNAPGGDREYRLLLVPFWCPVLVTALLPTWWYLTQLSRASGEARTRAGLCPGCGYDLRATPGRCPECGTVPVGKKV